MLNAIQYPNVNHKKYKHNKNRAVYMEQEPVFGQIIDNQKDEGLSANYDQKTAEMIKAEQSLNTLRHLFNIDENIKKEMSGLAPLYFTDPNYGDGLGYDGKINKGLKKLDYQFDSLIQNLGQLEVNVDIDNLRDKKNLLIDKFKVDIAHSEFNFTQLAKVCKEDVAYMDPEFIKTVNTEIIGYYIYKNFDSVLAQVKTLNELLHLVHTYVQSDELFYETLPKWGEVREERIEYDAYGEKTEYSSQIFNAVSAVLKVEQIDALGNKVSPIDQMHLYSLDNKTQLLIRNYGHALSIEVDTSNPIAAMVRYSIPKPINIEIINKLPGVRKIENDEWIGTSGSFELPYDHLGSEIANFILKIPTDVMLLN